MERLTRRIQTAQQSLNTLAEILPDKNASTVNRDATILRFQIASGAIWKLLQTFLKEVHGTDIGSPKQAYRAAIDVNILNEEQISIALAMVDDRNLATHTYDESLADAVSNRVDNYFTLMQHILNCCQTN